MQVTRYIFQSPYHNQIQIGKPEMGSSREQGSSKGTDTELLEPTNLLTKEASAFNATQKEEVTPSVKSELDIYA